MQAFEARLAVKLLNRLKHLGDIPQTTERDIEIEQRKQDLRLLKVDWRE